MIVVAAGTATPPKPEDDSPETFLGLDWDDPENRELLSRAKWVTTTLLDLDFTLAQIEELILVSDVRAKAARLRAKGMPHDLIVNELRD